MGILSRIILIILVIVFFLAILGLGWNTFFEGVKKGADKIGITSIIENATSSAAEIAKNASSGIVGSLLG
jgi:flagellar basal body-associated protein FliL